MELQELVQFRNLQEASLGNAVLREQVVKGGVGRRKDRERARAFQGAFQASLLDGGEENRVVAGLLEGINQGARGSSRCASGRRARGRASGGNARSSVSCRAGRSRSRRYRSRTGHRRGGGDRRGRTGSSGNRRLGR